MKKCIPVPKIPLGRTDLTPEKCLNLAAVAQSSDEARHLGANAVGTAHKMICERRNLYAPSIETQIVTGYCNTHGAYSAESWRFPTMQNWHQPGCKACVGERYLASCGIYFTAAKAALPPWRSRWSTCLRATAVQAAYDVAMANSFTRMPAYRRLFGFLTESDALKLLGQEWSGCDDLWRHRDWLCRYPLSVERKSLDLLMTADEMAVWHKLPPIVEVWRGCSRINAEGLSWSLDRMTAAQFPTNNRYNPPNGSKSMLLRAKVEKDTIAAIKLDRDESEVVLTHPPQTWSEVHAPAAPYLYA